MDSVLGNHILFTFAASAMQARDMALFEQTSKTASTMTDATQTWCGVAATNVHHTMRDVDELEPKVDRWGKYSYHGLVLEVSEQVGSQQQLWESHPYYRS